MKLIFCPNCRDMFRLFVEDEPRKCRCGQSWGRYKNTRKAVIGGKAIPIGIGNESFYTAQKCRTPIGLGYRFTAFVFPWVCESIVHEKDDG